MESKNHVPGRPSNHKKSLLIIKSKEQTTGVLCLQQQLWKMTLSLASEKQKTTRKRHGLLDRWRTPTSLENQRAMRPGPSSLAVGLLLQNHNASWERPMVVISRISQTQCLRIQPADENPPCSLAHGFMIWGEEGTCYEDKLFSALTPDLQESGQLTYWTSLWRLSCRYTAITRSYD